MKHSAIIARALALGLAAASMAEAEIQLSEKLKVDGFIDMSATYKDAGDETTKTMSFDQWEIDFHFEPVENVAARVDINHVNGSDEGVAVEQAFVTYKLADGLTAKAGKFLSSLGYEGAEPTLLYQYSVSATIIGYPGYSSGAALSYDFGIGSLHAAVVDGSFSGDNDAETVSPEVQIKLLPVEGLVLQAGYASEDFDAADTDGDGVADVGDYTKGIANFWVEYKVGGLTLAGEYNLLYDVQGPGSDGTGYLVMGNYSWGKFGLTLRTSGVDLDNGYKNTEYTISPSYQLAANLLGILEYRHDEFEGAADADTFAVELLYTF